MTTTDPAELPDLDRARAEASRLNEPAPATGRTEYDRLADVRPDLAERLARLEAEMHTLDRESSADPRRKADPWRNHVHISHEPGGPVDLSGEPR